MAFLNQNLILIIIFNKNYLNFRIYIIIGVVIFFSLVFSALCSVKKLNKRKQIFFVDLEFKKKLISAIFSGTVVINTSPQETISTIQVDNTSSSNAPPSYELVQQNRVDLNKYSRSDSIIQLDLSDQTRNGPSASLVLPASHIVNPPSYEEHKQQQIYNINNRSDSNINTK